MARHPLGRPGTKRNYLRTDSLFHMGLEASRAPSDCRQCRVSGGPMYIALLILDSVLINRHHHHHLLTV
jgi:hypothetical protein